MKCLAIIALSFILSTTCFADTHGDREVLLNNKDVEVVRLIYPAGAESGVHTHKHPNRVVYFVKGGTLELIPKNSKQSSKIIKVVDGQTLFLPATTHNVRNIGKTKVVIVETEIKNKPSTGEVKNK